MSQKPRMKGQKKLKNKEKENPLENSMRKI